MYIKGVEKLEQVKKRGQDRCLSLCSENFRAENDSLQIYFLFFFLPRFYVFRGFISETFEAIGKSDLFTFCAQ